MGFLRTVVKLAAVGMAANMILKARRDGAANGASTAGVTDGSRMGGSRPSASRIGMSNAASSGIGAPGPGASAAMASDDFGVSAGGSGLDSPNVAERLEAQGFGTTPGAARNSSDKPFGSDSQEGSTARSPGLSDFTRGA